MALFASTRCLTAAQGEVPGPCCTSPASAPQSMASLFPGGYTVAPMLCSFCTAASASGLPYWDSVGAWAGTWACTMPGWPLQCDPHQAVMVSAAMGLAFAALLSHPAAADVAGRTLTAKLLLESQHLSRPGTWCDSWMAQHRLN